MNNGSEYEIPSLEQFFAEAEMESEFGRRGSPGGRRVPMRRPVRRRVGRLRAAAVRRPRLPFDLKRPKFRLWPRRRFPIRFPIPAILHPSLWPDLYPPPTRTPDQPSGGPGAAAPPSAGPSAPPPSAEPSAPPPPEAAADEPSDTGATAQPSSAAIEAPDSGAAEPSGADATAPTAEPNEELLQFFSGYEYPQSEFGMQPQYEINSRNRAGQCQCGHTRSKESASTSSGLLSQFFEQGEGAFGECEFSLTQIPQSVLGLLRSGLESAGLKLATTFGYRNDTQLTDLIFNVRHPERMGRPITAGENNYSQLVREWLSIRDTVVRPALKGSATAPSRPSAPTGPPSTRTLDIVNVRGIQVARQIAQQVDRLLGAAAADGIRLGGGGYRSSAKQIELRRKHCGPTEYDIYKKPSSQCNPPTATPGKSNHEKGLAIDFTYNGRVINRSDSPAFKWLKGNAARFGLYNLPSEPWHWSINGR